MVIANNGPVRGAGRRIAIAVAGFTREVSEIMLERAVTTLEEHGVASDDIVVGRVPGSFELPLACEGFARTGEFDGVIALGCVIRGETSHFDYVCHAAAQGVLDVNLRHRVPVLFGVLTTDTRAQALARADGAKGDKGAECALGVLEMIGLMESI